MEATAETVGPVLVVDVASKLIIVGVGCGDETATAVARGGGGAGVAASFFFFPFQPLTFSGRAGFSAWRARASWQCRHEHGLHPGPV